MEIQFDEWYFEVTEIKCRKVKVFGDSPKAMYIITVADGEAHVEFAMSKDKVAIKDQRTLVKYLKYLGHKYYISSRYINNERVTTKTYI